MTPLTNERGFLTPEGELACKDVREQLKSVLAIPDNEINLRTLGSVLKAMVGEETSAAMLKVKHQ